MQNTNNQNTEEVTLPTMPKYITLAEGINETFTPIGTMENNDDVTNESLSSFTPKQKQVLNDIFDRRYSMLENLSK